MLHIFDTPFTWDIEWLLRVNVDWRNATLDLLMPLVSSTLLLWVVIAACAALYLARAGKAGLRQVDAGNIIHAADQNGIVVLTQLQPISVIFTLPEDNINKIQDRIQAGASMKVDVYNREQSRLLASGELTSLDNQIDASTGTLRLKAQLPNDDRQLIPNQFVNVRLLLDVVPQAVVVPSAAVQRGPQGAQSYVVRDDNVVELRKVELADSVKDEIIIRSGIKAGERVVVEGAERLRSGVEVEVKDDTAPSAASGAVSSPLAADGKGIQPATGADALQPARKKALANQAGK